MSVKGPKPAANINHLTYVTANIIFQNIDIGHQSYHQQWGVDAKAKIFDTKNWKI